MRLTEAWYRVTCNGGNGWRNAGLAFQSKGKDGKFKIGVKSKANFTKGEQVTFRTREDALAFAERVMNSEVGRKRGMTKIYEPQVISDSTSEQFVEVDTMFGKAYMRTDLAIENGYEVENHDVEIVDKITNVMKSLGYAPKDAGESSSSSWYNFTNPSFKSFRNTSIEIILLIPSGNNDVQLIFYCENAELPFYRMYLGKRLSLAPLNKDNSNLQNDIKNMLNVQLPRKYELALPSSQYALDRNRTEILKKFPFAEADLEYGLLF